MFDHAGSGGSGAGGMSDRSYGGLVASRTGARGADDEGGEEGL